MPVADLVDDRGDLGMPKKRKHPSGKRKPASVVVVSYVPLLTGEPGRTVAVDDPGISELLRQADD